MLYDNKRMRGGEHSLDGTGRGCSRSQERLLWENGVQNNIFINSLNPEILVLLRIPE